MARQSAVNISIFPYLFAVAIGMGTAIIIGRPVGGNEKEKAYNSVWLSVKWALLFTICMVTFVMIFRYPLLGSFTDDMEVIKIGTSVLLLSFLLETSLLSLHCVRLEM